MDTNQIRDLVAKDKIELAIQSVIDLTAKSDLEDLAIGISRNYRTLNKDTISGILSVAEQRQEHALVTSKILSLLNEYEISVIKDFRNELNNLKIEIESQGQSPEARETAKELDRLNKEIKDIDQVESKDEIEPGRLEKIGNFLKRLQDPKSTEGQVIQGIKNGVAISKKLAKIYNSIAQWFGLPQVPSVFL